MSNNSDDEKRERAAAIRASITPRPLDIAGAMRALRPENERMARELNASHVFELRISKIKIGERHRKDKGDIKALARSMSEIGLLQPIGVATGHRLVFGERRILAAKQLGWKTILARIVDTGSIIRGEYAENTIRKSFTPSERLAIAEALEKEMGERQGQRTDLAQHTPNLAEVPKGETRDIAAKRAGFGSHGTLENVKAVVAKGVPEVVAAMDKGDITISAAAQLTKLPTKEQLDALKGGARNIVAAARRLREQEKQKSLEAESALTTTTRVVVPFHRKSEEEPLSLATPAFHIKAVVQVDNDLFHEVETWARASGISDDNEAVERLLRWALDRITAEKDQP